MRVSRVAVLVLAAAILLTAAGSSTSAGTVATLVRVNQAGYATNDAKLAYALTARPTGRLAFSVLSARGRTALRGRTAGTCGAWNASWQGCQVLDLSRLRRAGTYRVRIAGTSSQAFRVAPAATLYAPLAGREVAFLQSQRDGPDVIAGPMGRRPAHLGDATASVDTIPAYRNGQLASPLRPTGATVDLSGGWFDAGDYLKFSGTAAFTDTLLLFTLREYGSALPSAPALRAEARFGTDWLLKTWDAQRRTLYEQVGIGDGNGGSVLGDHDIWRLPQRDDAYRAHDLRYVAHRPAFAVGAPVSPNLAGREVAAFALCAQVFHASDPAYAHTCLMAGQSLFDAAATRWRGPLAGSVPASYYAAAEGVWQDDLELGATELYLATRALAAPDVPHPDAGYYLKPASWWADHYESSPRADQDSLNLYDVSGLADYDLYRIMVATGHTTDLWTNASDVLGDLRDQLALAARLSRRGPLGLADPASPADTVGHALGYAAEAHLYGAITGRPAYGRLADRQLGWVLGANPWGSSFVVGAGSTFPHCLASQIPNLSGSLTGRGRIDAGAVVDGPTGATELGQIGAPDGYRRCSAGGRFRPFDGRGFHYLDDVRSPSTSEPSDDLAALALLVFAQEAATR